MKFRFFSAIISLISTAVIFLISSCNQDSNTAKTFTDGQTPLQVQPKDSLCDWVDSLSTIYEDSIRTRLDAHKEFLKNEGPNLLEEKWNEKILKDPIDVKVGERYMASYRRSIFERKPAYPAGYVYTQGVVLTSKELAYYLKYLYDNDLESVHLAFSRFDLASLRADSLTHRELENDQSKDGRLTLITGVSYPKGKVGASGQYMSPFKISRKDKYAKTDSTEFYDDWHELWP